MREVISNRLSAVSIRDLLLVEAVAQQHGFRRAAELIGISTSGLSHQIKKVEEIMGTAIFERGTQITLTADGAIILEAITATLQSVTRLEAIRERPAIPFGPVLRIGVISSLAPMDLVRFVECCRHNSPLTKIEIVSGKHLGLIRRLQEREIDLLITAGSDLPDGLSSSQLRNEGFALLVNQALGVRQFSDLTWCKTALLPISEDDFLPQKVSAGFSDLINSSLTRAYGLSIEHRVAMVSSGYGHALLPKGWVQGISDSEATAIIELPETLSGKRTLRCIWRNSFAFGPRVAEKLQVEPFL